MLAEDEGGVGVKTRHATLEQLVEIEEHAVLDMLKLYDVMERAGQFHFGLDSRHYRRLMRKHNSLWLRYIAAQKQANRILHPQDPEFLF